MLAFTDGVFAIAITLLVLALEMPANLATSAHALRDRSDDFFAYAISFAVLGSIWIDHHRFFTLVARFDGRLIALNLLYLALVALVPFSASCSGTTRATPPRRDHLRDQPGGDQPVLHGCRSSTRVARD